MPRGFKAFACKLILLLSILVAVDGKAGVEGSAVSSTPAYWRGMISSLPQGDIPEEIFKEKDLVDSPSSSLLKKAVESFHNNEYQAAEKYLKEILGKFPKDEAASYARFILGDVYSRMAVDKGQGALQAAVDQYIMAVREHPGSEDAPRGLYQAGRAFFARGFYYEAVAQLDRIAAQYPQSPYVQKGMLAKGIIFYYQKKYSSAESVMKKILSDGSSSEEGRDLARLWLGNTLHMAGKFIEARELYRSSRPRSPEEIKKNKISFLNMGENFMCLGDYRAGRSVLQQFVNEASVAPSVMLRTADAFRLEGDREEAFKLYSKVVSLYPTNEEALIGEARVAEKEIEGGKPEPANVLLKELLPMKGEVPREAALIVADALKRHGYSSDAAKAYKALLQQNGSKDSGLLQGSMLESVKDSVAELYGKKDYLGVLKLYHEESRLLREVNEPRLLKAIGHSYLEVGLPSEAAAVYDRLLTNMSQLPAQIREDALVTAPEAYLQAGRRADAEKTANRLLKEFPNSKSRGRIAGIISESKGKIVSDGTTKGHMATAAGHLSAGRNKEAVEYFKKVIAMKDPLFLASAYVGLGDSYFGMGRYREAVDAYDTGKAAGGEAAMWALYRIGECYSALGDAAKARSAFQSVVKEDKGTYRKMAAEELKLLK